MISLSGENWKVERVTRVKVVKVRFCFKKSDEKRFAFKRMMCTFRFTNAEPTPGSTIISTLLHGKINLKD